MSTSLGKKWKLKTCVQVTFFLNVFKYTIKKVLKCVQVEVLQHFMQCALMLMNHDKTSVLFSNNIGLKNVFNIFKYWAYIFNILIQYVLM